MWYPLLLPLSPTKSFDATCWELKETFSYEDLWEISAHEKIENMKLENNLADIFCKPCVNTNKWSRLNNLKQDESMITKVKKTTTWSRLHLKIGTTPIQNRDYRRENPWKGHKTWSLVILCREGRDTTYIIVFRRL